MTARLVINVVTKTSAERYRGRLMSGLDLASVERPQPRQKAPVRAPKPKIAPLPTPAQAKRLATLDAAWAGGLVTRAVYDARKAEILG